MKKFEVILLETAREFLLTLNKQDSDKIIYNIRKSQITLDPELFKKLKDEIWEFRTKFKRKFYRMLAFWDKRDNKNTLVVCSHGFVKKTKKVPEKEIERAKMIMNDYFKNQ